MRKMEVGVAAAAAEPGDGRWGRWLVAGLAVSAAVLPLPLTRLHAKLGVLQGQLTSEEFQD